MFPDLLVQKLECQSQPQEYPGLNHRWNPWQWYEQYYHQDVGPPPVPTYLLHHDPLQGRLIFQAGDRLQKRHRLLHP